jgi:hypothetical protein
MALLVAVSGFEVATNEILSEPNSTGISHICLGLENAGVGLDCLIEVRSGADMDDTKNGYKGSYSRCFTSLCIYSLVDLNALDCTQFPLT